jgi:hypothetical protein
VVGTCAFYFKIIGFLKKDVEHAVTGSVKPLQIFQNAWKMSAVDAFFAFVRLNLKSGEDEESCLNFLETLDITPNDKSYCIGMLERRIQFNMFAGNIPAQPTSAIPYEASYPHEINSSPQIQLEIMRVALAGIQFCKMKIDDQDSEEDTDSE